MSDRKVLTHLQTSNHKKSPTMKKSRSLRFNTEEDEQNESKRLRNRGRSSFDNSLIQTLNESDEFNSSFEFVNNTTTCKIYQDNLSVSKSVATQCDFSDDVDKLELILSQDELKLKEKNPDSYWKIIAEKLRGELYEHLQENVELHKLKDELKDEHQELTEEKEKLTELIEQANELLNAYNDLTNNQNDSGTNE